MHPTRIDLPEGLRAQIVSLTNERLADLIDLGLQAKHAHWNVKGPSFIALHELFDEIADEVDGHVDALAERITALGGVAEGTLAKVGQRTSLPPYRLEITRGLEHVDALATAFSRAASAMRTSIDRATELGDAITADLFTGIGADLDKRLWFLEAHLQAES